MRIDVYEQCLSSIEKIRKTIMEVSIQENIEFEVKWFYGPNAVQGKVNLPGTASIMLIDMELPMAESISKKYFSEHRSCRQLIFGKNCEVLPDWIPYGPTGYSSDVDTIKASLVRLLREVICDSNWFHFTNRRQSIHIPIGEILYFQSDLRYIDIVTVGNCQTRIMAKMDDIASSLPGSAFLRIHKSYLVNTQHVRTIDFSEHTVMLSSKKKLSISQNNYAAVRNWEKTGFIVPSGYDTGTNGERYELIQQI